MTDEKPKPVLAYHFVGKTLCDGRKLPRVGQWLEHRGELVMCQTGLHASRRPIDALKYAPGNVLCRVECAGKVVEDEDKLVCSRRKILWKLSATGLLKAFARHEAVSVLHLWDQEAPAVVDRYLRLGREKDRAAAGDAAWAAARAAARAAAWAAARAAARDAAGDAAWAAARDAAWAAARAAAWDAAWGEANATLEEMITEHRAGIREWEWYL